jgi:cation transport ATPase
MDTRMKELEKIISEKDREQAKLGESKREIEDRLVDENKKIQDKEKEIDEYKNALQNEKKKRKFIIYLFLMTLLLLFVGWIIFYSSFGNQLKVLWSSSAGLIILVIDIIARKSGLWSFISLILNIFKHKNN